ncbi:MAG TPA: hypothetical protein VGD07_08945 [Methylomirabilota bacterium]
MEAMTILKLLWLAGLVTVAVVAVALALVVEHLRQRAVARGALRSSDCAPAVETARPERGRLRRRALVRS